MKRSFKAIVAALLIATPLLSGCSDIAGPVEPTPTVAPQDGLLGGLVGLVGGVVNGLLGILSGPDANGPEATAWIGVQGGTIKTAAYTLTVPAGAVTTSTRFDLEPANDGTYKIELDAYQRGLLGLNNVGRYGFLKPVTITFSYANAVGVDNVQDLTVIYLRPDGRVEEQATTINTSTKTISSALKHFSKYAMAED